MITFIFSSLCTPYRYQNQSHGGASLSVIIPQQGHQLLSGQLSDHCTPTSALLLPALLYPRKVSTIPNVQPSHMDCSSAPYMSYGRISTHLVYLGTNKTSYFRIQGLCGSYVLTLYHRRMVARHCFDQHVCLSRLLLLFIV